MNRLTLITAALFVALTLLAAPALAGTQSLALYNHDALLDIDNNPATGGSVWVVQGDEDPSLIYGIEYIVRAVMGVVVPNGVTQNSKQSKIGSAHTGPDTAHIVQIEVFDSDDFFNPFIQYNPAQYAVGDNVGLNGTDMVEFFATRQDLGYPVGTMRVVYHSSILAVNDYTNAFNFNLGNVPALSVWGTAAFVLLLGLAALWMLRKRRSALTSALLITLMMVGVAWAVTITMDGAAGDWAGVPVAVTDDPDDSSNDDSNEDIRYGFITVDQDNIYFRVDIDDVQSLCGNCD